MNALACCPDDLPDDLAGLVAEFGRLWAQSPIRPTLEASVLVYWSKLLNEWVEDKTLPLLIRKASSDRGSIIIHDESGREIVQCDNSPAHWAYMKASRGEMPTLDDIRTLFRYDRLPVVMIQKAKVEDVRRLRHTLTKDLNVNLLGWKLAHIDPVGLKTRTPIAKIRIAELEGKFINLMSPQNMFVVPKVWYGIAETKAVIDAVREAQTL